MAQFFLRRPAFAWVLAILTMVAGLLALNGIPVAQYPAVALPTVILYADYPGATARTVEDRVTAVLEQADRTAKADPVFAEVRAMAGQPVPALDLAIDYRKAESFGVETETIHHAMSATLGSRYIDELARDGRVARDPAGRCTVPHAARRPEAPARAQRTGPDGVARRIRHARLGQRRGNARTLQRVDLGAYQCRCGAEHEHRHGE